MGKVIKKIAEDINNNAEYINYNSLNPDPNPYSTFRIEKLNNIIDGNKNKIINSNTLSKKT